jgi:hypothetical protein
MLTVFSESHSTEFREVDLIRRLTFSDRCSEK